MSHVAWCDNTRYPHPPMSSHHIRQTQHSFRQKKKVQKPHSAMLKREEKKSSIQVWIHKVIRHKMSIKLRLLSRHREVGVDACRFVQVVNVVQFRRIVFVFLTFVFLQFRAAAVGAHVGGFQALQSRRCCGCARAQASCRRGSCQAARASW